MARYDHLQKVHDIPHVLAHILREERSYSHSFPYWGHVAYHVGAVQEASNPGAEIWLPARLVDETHGLAERVLRDNIRGVAVEGLLQVKGAFGVENLVAGTLGEFEDFALKFENLGS